MSQENEPTFEQALQALEETVSRLERGQLPLDDAIALFERGMGLADRCAAMLDAAELRVSMLAANARGERELVPFIEE